MILRPQLLRPIAIGLPALAIVTSCVPQDPPRVAASQAVPKPDARTLLRRLALKVPDATDAALPPVLPTIETPFATPAAAPPFTAQAHSTQDFDRAEDCLTAAIYYEARSQGEDGQRAVAQVVLNRVRDLAFPSSVCGVVYQGSNRRTGCQFSFTCDGSMYRRRDPWAWDRARVIASAALGGAVFAPVGSATHYHAAYVSPWWAPSLSRIGQVGAHIFYRWQNGMERALAFRQEYSGIEPGIGGGGPPIAVAGIASDYAEETVAGVTIHRGDGLSSGQASAQTPIPAAHLLRASSVAGVRIHFGRSMPSSADADTADADDKSASADSGTI